MEEPNLMNRTTPRMIVCIIGSLLAGLLIFFMGICYANDTLKFMPIDPHAYNIVKLVLSVIVLGYAVYAFRNKVLLEGFIIFLIGMSSLIFSMTYLIYSEGGLSILDIVFGVALVVMSLQVAKNRDWVLFVSVLTAGIGFILAGLNTGGVTEGIFLLFSGAVMSSHAALQMMSAEISPNAVHCDFSDTILVESVGILVFGIACIVVGVWNLDNVIPLWDEEANSYNMSKVVLSLAVLVFSFYAVRVGEFATGMAMILFGVSCLTFSISIMVFGNSSVELVDVVFGMVFFVSSAILYFKGEKIKAAAFFLLFFTTTFYPLFGGDAMYLVLGLPLIGSAVLLITSSIMFSLRSNTDIIPQ
ncbi:MAG: hypothetical protein WCR96_05705 [Candidatus Methanomethylophilaceae archaeon]